jgi:uncharacterized protein YndB with AHSA1/START domain
MTNDRIEREITINAPVEGVWAVLTEPDLVTQWLSPGKPAEVDLRQGGTMRFNHGEDRDFPARIVRLEPPTRLAYRWATGYPGEEATEDNSTMVEFTLEPAGEGTLLRLVESGFARLDLSPESTGSYENHLAGWTPLLDGLVGVVEHLPV